MKRGYFILWLSCLGWNAFGQSFTGISTGISGTIFSASAWADYDLDGDQDLLMAGYPSSLLGTSAAVTKLYRNDGGGVFTEVPVSIPGMDEGSLDWADYDLDGDPDILVSGNIGTNQGICQVYRNDGGVFTDINAGMTGAYVSCARWGDYDQDGYPDLLLIGGDAAVSQWYVTKLYHNNQNHTFTEVSTSITPTGNREFDWGDYDNDGDLDLVIAASTVNGFHTLLYRNDGNAVFTKIDPGMIGIYQSGVEFGDYDNDGLLDILAVGRGLSDFYSTIYRNNGNGNFTNINAGLTGLAEADGTWADYDGDCDLDVLICGYIADQDATRTTKIYRNDGNNVFAEETGLTIEGVSACSANWIDYDNDGDKDFFIAGSDETYMPFAGLYRNNINNVPANPIVNAIDDIHLDSCVSQARNFTILSNDLNIHSDSVNLSIISVQQGQVVIQPDKSILYIPKDNLIATDTIIYEICDRYCEKGCDRARLILCKEVKPILPEPELFIPNLVIPNGDGRNDYFEITGLPSGCQLTICNRWGDIVFTSNDYKNNWSGDGLGDGIYYYYLQNKSSDDSYKGWVQLLK